MLRLSAAAHAAIIAHLYDGLPDEACGLLFGDPTTGDVPQFYPTANAAKSSKL
jgi:proteasome lid subunit RPN8/RPN11